MLYIFLPAEKDEDYANNLTEHLSLKKYFLVFIVGSGPIRHSNYSLYTKVYETPKLTSQRN